MSVSRAAAEGSAQPLVGAACLRMTSDLFD
jgi:hypothetical protein